MKKLKRVFIKGGILSPSELKNIIRYSESLGLDTIYFGSRQDIIFPDHDNENTSEEFAELKPKIIEHEISHNIVCSYVSSDIFTSTSWINGSTYLYILENFKYKPQLRINITDPQQQLVPLFSGQLNFIASKHEDYWYLKIHLPNLEEPKYYPVLIYSWDIPKITKAIEDTYETVKTVDELFHVISEKTETNSRVIDKPLKIKFRPFPYYEGMNKMGINQYWLGLYWRNNKYELTFLKDFCDFCLENKVGKICITPWKSIIVKGIPKESKLMIERFLGKRGINVRHSSLELNWHLPVNDENALKLKTFIVNNFNQNDISTYGLTFAITDLGNLKAYFTSIVIERNPLPSIVKGYNIRPTYNVLYCEKFNPNSQNYSVYAQDVDKVELSGLLMELSKMYFEQFGNENTDDTSEKEIDTKETKEVYQCSDCLTIYDELLGDMNSNIQPNSKFEDLPETYTCSVCEAPKETYLKVSL